MNEKQLKFYIALIYVGVFTAVILLVIDFKLKADTFKMLGGDMSGAGPAHQNSNWNSVRFAHSDLRPVPDSRFAPRVEEGSDNHVPSNQVWAAEAGTELGDGEGDPGIPEDDQQI